MEKTYTDKELHSVLEHVKKRLEESETDFERYYWNLRIRDIEAEIKNRQN